jgi:hypothetical protein
MGKIVETLISLATKVQPATGLSEWPQKTPQENIKTKVRQDAGILASLVVNEKASLMVFITVGPWLKIPCHMSRD